MRMEPFNVIADPHGCLAWCCGDALPHPSFAMENSEHLQDCSSLPEVYRDALTSKSMWLFCMLLVSRWCCRRRGGATSGQFPAKALRQRAR